MTDHFIFGYGSLVNSGTHDYPLTHLATLNGWRRGWVASAGQDIAFLTAVPDAKFSIKGVIMAAPKLDPALDKRETGYDRVSVREQVDHGLDSAVEINTYAIPADRHRPKSEAIQILMSYLDVVVQGYHHEFGELGVQQFFETTLGWDIPVVDDRSSPRYPRHQTLSPDQAAMTDHWLNSLEMVVLQS